jgi:hypothetical protein
MFARSFASAALVAFSLSMLPSAGFAKTPEAGTARTTSCSAFRIPGAVPFVNGPRFDAAWSATPSASTSVMIPKVCCVSIWPLVVCYWC